MGLAREYLRNIRKEHLTEGDDWFLDGRAVLLTNAGVDGILRYVGLEPGEIPPKEPPVLVQVVKTWRNPCLLGCVRVEADTAESAAILNVWVRNHKLFKIGQQIPVKRTKGRWVLAIRQPRTRGKLK